RTAVGRAKSVRLQRSEGTIASTLLALMFDKSIQWPLVVTTADHALLERVMVDQLLTDADGADVAVAVVEQTALMQRLPQTRRTGLKFRNGAYTGANLFVFGSPKAAAAIEIWRSVEQDRKKGWRMIAALGPMTLIGTALRLLTIDQTAARLGRKLGLNVRIVRIADPLAGIDVDKLDDLKLVEAIVAGRA
ncbi:MAG TPA: 4-diphosphocytidyl-2C-methyl-D-erythritol synthase, partial [Sphingomicrobium sp.]|nr:4-diphosphocytidyl-2C-methyl-D-erythritol synthase [Sphingomicrobium sp.]